MHVLLRHVEEYRRKPDAEHKQCFNIPGVRLHTKCFPYSCARPCCKDLMMYIYLFLLIGQGYVKLFKLLWSDIGRASGFVPGPRTRLGEQFHMF